MVGRPKGGYMDEVITGIITGICTSATIAFLVWFYTVARNFRLRSKIKKAFHEPGVFESTDGLGIVLENNLHISLIIRNVALRLSATKGHPERPDGGEYGTFKLNYCSPQICGHPHEGFKFHDEVRGFIKLPPYTRDYWIISWDAIKGKYLKFIEFKGVEITVEYLTLLKVPKVFIIKDKRPSGAATFINKSRNKYTNNGEVK